MLFPSALQRARLNLLKCSCRNRSAGLLPGGCREWNSPFSLNFHSRKIGHCNTTNPLRTSWMDISPPSLSTLPPILSRNAYFSTDGEENLFVSPLIIDTTQEIQIPSPSDLVQRIWGDVECPPAVSCKYVVINKDGKDETWYTATYTWQRKRAGQEFFHSGKFGGFIDGICKNAHADISSFSSEPTCVIDGKVYYQSEYLAKEAAAARTLDCLAFRAKYLRGKDRWMTADDTLKPLRYCVERPYPFPMFGNEITLNDGKKKNSHAPFYFWSCMMEAKYGPIDVIFDVKSFSVNKSDTGQRAGESEETWFSAECIEPKTGEAFSSGVFGLTLVGNSDMPDAPTTPLPLEEFDVFDGKVCYRDEMTAKHAAAARAIDCLEFRAGNRIKEEGNLCLEDPYLTSSDKQHMLPTNYEKLKAIIQDRRSGDPSSSFSDNLNLKHATNSPENSLQNRLLNKYNRLHNKKGIVGSFGKGYELMMLNSEGRRWATASFIDPVTKENFPSGVVKGKPGIDIRVIDGRVCFGNIADAIKAAASRAIDCYHLREKVATPMQLCYEEPYKSGELVFQAIDYQQILAQRESDDYKQILAKQEREKLKRSPFLHLAQHSPQLFHVPKNLLGNALSLKYKRNIKIQACFITKEKQYEGQTFFTAIFTDPETKEQFSSGLLGKVDVEKHPSACLKTPPHLAEAKILDGRVYYCSRQVAEHAAAARAIDCHISREEVAEVSNICLCLEDPYKTEEDGASQKVDYDELLHQRHLLSANEHESKAHTDNSPKEENYGVGQMQPIQEELPTLDFSVTNNRMQADSPLSTMGRIAEPLSTMGRIAEAWIDTDDLGSWGGASYSRPVETANVQDNITQSPSEKVENIIEWFERVNHAPQNREEAVALARLCSKILHCLGNANSEMVLHEKENRINVEDDAKVILENIISMARNFDDQCFLDADVFNSWIRCLDPSDSIGSAKSAENLLKSMVNHEKYGGIDLPPPNVDTYNAVMSLWAKVDGVEGKNGVNDINSLLEDASLGSDSKRPTRSNKETFKVLLAANSKIDGLFSFEQAKLSLARMQQSSMSGDTFIADADIYAAALSSLPTKAEACPASNRHTSWLSYGHQYAGGFKAANECSDIEAQAKDMEKWLLYTEGCGVNPSEEMYEAVIHGWIETGTKDGLLMAEEWAKRAISSNSPIHLRTFYPIIAAWAQCPFKRGADRVKQWNEQLAAMSTQKPHLKPDLNTLSAHIIAWRNVQGGIMDTVKDTEKPSSDEKNKNIGFGSEKKSLEETFAAAQHCTLYLKEIYSNYNWLDGEHDTLQDTQALITMFAHAVEAWGRASRFALLHSLSSASLDTLHGVQEMLKIARLFDALDRDVRLFDALDGDVPEKYVQNMVSLIGECFTAIISQLHKIDSTAGSDGRTNCYFAEKISHIERMLRDYEFFSRKHSSRSSSTSDQKSLRHRLYKEILRGCAAVQAPTDFGNVMRICRLIMDHLSWHDTQCNGGHLEDISHIYVDMALLMETVVSSPHERMYVLTTIYNNASHFFEEKKKTEASMYATVDKARLIGAMRLAMGDSELTDDFIRNFDERAFSKRRARDNTAMAFVEDMVNRT